MMILTAAGQRLCHWLYPHLCHPFGPQCGRTDRPLFKAATTLPHLDEPSYDPQSEVDATSNAVKIAVVLGVVFVVYLMWLIAGGAREDEVQVAAPVAVENAGSGQACGQTGQPASGPSSAAKAERPANTPVAKAPAAAPQAEPPQVDVKPLAAPSVNDTAAVLPEADPLATDPVVEVNAMADLKPAAERKVEIRATRRTWMRIENRDGKVLFSSIIRGDESFTLEETTPYTLATRDAGALEFVVDGEKGRHGRSPWANFDGAGSRTRRHFGPSKLAIYDAASLATY